MRRRSSILLDDAGLDELVDGRDFVLSGDFGGLVVFTGVFEGVLTGDLNRLFVGVVTDLIGVRTGVPLRLLLLLLMGVFNLSPSGAHGFKPGSGLLTETSEGLPYRSKLALLSLGNELNDDIGDPKL